MAVSPAPGQCRASGHASCRLVASSSSLWPGAIVAFGLQPAGSGGCREALNWFARREGLGEGLMDRRFNGRRSYDTNEPD
jgi:hypothetical protein